MKIIPKDPGIIHLIGIGGIGMSAIACILYQMGYKTQGSDLNCSGYIVDNIKNLGIKCMQGHSTDNIASASLVIISTAIKEDNVELIEAKRRHIPVIHRSEMLAEFIRFKHSIAVSGTHGKTTTTTMLATIFENMGEDPTVINGGMINHKNSNAYLGQSKFLIAEADESDTTFTRVSAYVAIITNINPEHLEFYDNDFEKVKSAYLQFVENIPFYGFAVLCFDHKDVIQLAGKVSDRRIISYGIENKQVDLYGYNIRNDGRHSVFDISLSDNMMAAISTSVKVIRDVKINCYGKHNVCNFLAAVAVALEHGLSVIYAKSIMMNFKGVKRRFTFVDEVSGRLIIDDYAHHPVEIKATLEAAKTLADNRQGKLLVIMEPHKYSRLHDYMDEFAASFTNADYIAITDVYSAGQSEVAGASSDVLCTKIATNNKQVYRVSMLQDIVNYVYNYSSKGDVVICLGAGSITKIAYSLPEELKKQGI